MPVGSAVEGEAVRITEFGVFVELEPGIEGLVHISEISEERVEKPSDKVTKGDKVKAIVISIDKQAKKIALSMKAVASGEYKSNYKPEVAQPSTLADKLKGFKV
jgi:small subunit ribosomal protein S1